MTVDSERTAPGAIPAEAQDRLHNDAQRALAESFAGGLAFAITDRERIVAGCEIGFADIAAKREVDADTLFEIGSISKGFAAVCILRAQAEGLLDVHRPVSDYLPWFSVRSRFEPITVHHLLSHTAGIVLGADITNDPLFEVWALRDTEATAGPGTYFHYSNVGYKTIGLILEAVAGRPYTQTLRDDVLSPLRMDATEVAITHELRPRLAVGYAPRFDDRPPLRLDGLVPATWLESDAADGSISSTARDMTAYVRMLLNGGQGPGGTVLSPKDFEAMTSGTIESDDEEPGSLYGYGIARTQIDGRTCLSHTGGMVGYTAAMFVDLDDGVGAVVLGSGEGAWRTLAEHLLAVVRAGRRGAAAPELRLPAAEASPLDGTRGKAPPLEWAAFVGHYRSHNPWLSNFHVVARDGRLWLLAWGHGDQPSAPLEPLGPAVFRVGQDERSPERLRFDAPIEGRASRATYSGCPYYRTFTP